MKAGRLLILIGLIVLQAACTEKAPPIVQHAPDQRPELDQTVTDPRVLDEPGPSEQTVRVSGHEDLNVLGARVLSVNRIQDKKSLTTRLVRDELLLFNNRLLRTPAKDRANLIPLLTTYAQRVELECPVGGIKSSCAALDYFRLTGTSAEVLKMMAVMPQFASRQSRLLLFAVELKNRLPDPHLARLLLTFVTPEKSSQGEAVRSMLQSALAVISTEINDPAKLKEFLDAIKAWDLIEGRRWKLDPPSLNILWGMISRGRFIYSNGSRLSPEFLKLVADSQKSPGSLTAKQAAAAGRNFRPEPLGAQSITRPDELVFLLDSVFMQAMSPQNAAEIFRASGRPINELLAALTNYVRLRFALGIEESSLKFRDILNAPVQTELLLHNTVRLSPVVRKVWNDLEDSFQLLKTFASLSVERQTGGSEAEANIRSLFGSFPRQINLSVTYPHQLLLFNRLSQKRFKILFGTTEYDTAELMEILFYGQNDPFLDYTAEKVKLNQFEILHAFDMLIRSQLLASQGIDPDAFIADTLLRLTEKPMLYVQNELDVVARRFGEAPQFREFRDSCREFKGGKPLPREINLEGVRRSPYYGSAIEMIFLPLSSKGGSTTGATGSLFAENMGLSYFDGEYNEALEKIRLEISQYERVGQAMLSSYTDYLKRYEKLDDAQITKRTLKTRQQLEAMTAMQKRALDSSRVWMKEVGFCYFKAAQKDFDTTNEVIKLEIGYLREVYRDIRRLRALQVDGPGRAEIEAKYKLKGLAGNFTGLDRITADGYLATSVDFLVRSLRFIQRVEPNIRPNFGLLNMDVELVSKAITTYIPYTDSEQEFVANALRAYFMKGGAYALWIQRSGDRFAQWSDYIKGMISSYRMEIDLSGEAKTFTPDRILNIHQDILNTTALNQDDRSLYAILHGPTRIGAGALNQILITYTGDDESGSMKFKSLLGLFDLPVFLVGLEKLGWDHTKSTFSALAGKNLVVPRRLGFMDMGRQYFQARSNLTRGQPILPFNPSLDQNLDASVGQFVRRELKAIADFHAATKAKIAAAERLPPSQRPRADLDIRTSLTELISPNLIPNYEATVDRFRSDTEACYFGPCSEFKK